MAIPGEYSFLEPELVVLVATRPDFLPGPVATDYQRDNRIDKHNYNNQVRP